MRDVIAVFIGYQEDPELGPIPLFNILGNHPRNGSTVDGNTLIREGIAFPVRIAPTLEEWEKRRKSK